MEDQKQDQAPPSELSDQVERGDTAPEQIDAEASSPSSPSDEVVHLPGILSDEFGMSRSEARRLIGMGKVEIDGEIWTGDQQDLPIGAIEGKTVRVSDGPKTVQFQYRKDARRDRYFG